MYSDDDERDQELDFGEICPDLMSEDETDDEIEDDSDIDYIPSSINTK